MLFYRRGHRLIGGVGLLSGGARAQQLLTNKFPPNASCHNAVFTFLKFLLSLARSGKVLGSSPIFLVSMNTQMWTYQPEYRFSL